MGDCYVQAMGILEMTVLYAYIARLLGPAIDDNPAYPRSAFPAPTTPRIRARVYDPRLTTLRVAIRPG